MMTDETTDCFMGLNKTVERYIRSMFWYHEGKLNIVMLIKLSSTSQDPISSL